MSLNHVPAGLSLPDDIYVIIEIPANANPIKYEVNKAAERYLLTDLCLLRCFIHVITAISIILYL